MADATAATKTTPPTISPATKKAKSGAAKLPSHPPTSDMVNAAIKSLRERSGSSLHAIKKYITSTYKVDAKKLSPFIKNYLKRAVIDGILRQTKGKGASGSFKLSAATGKPMSEATPSKKIAAPKKAKAAAGEKKPKAKKAVSPAKKKPAEKKKNTELYDYFLFRFRTYCAWGKP